MHNPRYMTGELASSLDRVEHYVDGDTGTVTDIYRTGGHYVATVSWDLDGETEHNVDELKKIRI